MLKIDLRGQIRDSLLAKSLIDLILTGYHTDSTVGTQHQPVMDDPRSSRRKPTAGLACMLSSAKLLSRKQDKEPICCYIVALAFS